MEGGVIDGEKDEQQGMSMERSHSVALARIPPMSTRKSFYSFCFSSELFLFLHAFAEYPVF